MAGGENGAVILDIDDIGQLLASGADRRVAVGDIGVDGGSGSGASGELSHTHLDHALQTAAVLRQRSPQDEELWVAGLVHDIGHLLPGVGDAEHAAAGAAAVRGALGERVAELVGLHVEAKRYLVGSEAGYGGELAADSVASLALQGGPMSPAERAAFVSSPHWADAVVLRRADESGKVEGLVVDYLAGWMPAVWRVHRRSG
jgi:predicted HD phosphohydrolase